MPFRVLDGGVEICLVRHGETTSNVDLRVQGWTGGGLTALGRRQAAMAGVELRRRHHVVPVVWSSDLDRARETATFVARPLKAVVRPDRHFREIRLGPWEGRLLADISSEDGAALARWRINARRPPRRGIESLGRLRDRLVEGVDRLAARGESPVIIVTHGGAISVLLTHYLGMPLRTVSQMPVENVSISRLYREGKRTFVLSYNETGHLVSA